MKAVFQRNPIAHNTPSPYCPGCGHGIVHRLVIDAIKELGMENNCIFMAPVGCSILAYTWLDLDICQPAHGRTPAVATGLKRACPDTLIVMYQGDGDLAAIGTAEIIHAANRGEHLTGIFVNNAIYGMTGGQMAPTTLIGQRTTTSPDGRDPAVGMGYPIRVCELLQSLGGVTYLTRTSIHDAPNVIKTKKAIINGFQNQIDKKGFSLIEILSMCPTNWKMTSLQAQQYVKDKMAAYFPLGEFKVNGKIMERTV
ncbi:MAG: thiamine pyrophosphate-dependent enzyme [Planctomycetota bacterium]